MLVTPPGGLQKGLITQASTHFAALNVRPVPRYIWGAKMVSALPYHI